MYRSEAPAAYWRDQLFLWGPRVLFAILILIVTHFVAKGVQWGIAKGVDRMPILKRHPTAGGDSDTRLAMSSKVRPRRGPRSRMIVRRQRSRLPQCSSSARVCGAASAATVVAAAMQGLSHLEDRRPHEPVRSPRPPRAPRPRAPTPSRR